MSTNRYRDQVRIQQRVSTQGALGEAVIWKPVETRYALVTSLDAAARLIHQQLQKQVSHRVEFREGIDLTLGDYRFLWKGLTLEPVEPPTEVEEAVVILVREA